MVSNSLPQGWFDARCQLMTSDRKYDHVFVTRWLTSKILWYSKMSGFIPTSPLVNARERFKWRPEPPLMPLSIASDPDLRE